MFDMRSSFQRFFIIPHASYILIYKISLITLADCDKFLRIVVSLIALSTRVLIISLRTNLSTLLIVYEYCYAIM